MAQSAHAYEMLEHEALELSLEDRSKLAARLLESLDEHDDFQLSSEWADEIRRRVAAIDAGAAKLISHDEVIAGIREQLGKVHRGGV